MTIKVGINGFGRIGRIVFRAAQKRSDIEIVAINDLLDADYMAYMLKYDSTHGRFDGTVEVKDGHLIVNGKKIRVTAERDPANLKWDEVGVDVVAEATGLFLTDETARKHITAGAKKVVMTGPSKDNTPMFVKGANFDKYAGQDIVSNASCTTNCMCPFVKPLMDKLGIVDGMITTIHAFTNDQVLTDVKHKDLRRARAAADNIIPTKTGAAKAVGVVIPELKGKLDGYAMRVPTLNVSVADLTFNAKRPTTVEEVNKIILEASESPELKGILGYNELPLVSSDFNHTSFSSIFDATLTKVIDGTLVKAVAWYDNEWGFSCRMLDTAVAMYNAK